MPGPTLRPVRTDDAEFLFRLYASTRADELRPVPWDAARKEAFLRSQFAAQTTQYAATYADADFRVVEVDGRAAGRLVVHRGSDEVRIVDVSLLPEHRGRGLGTTLVGDVLAEAGDRGRRVTIHVERTNPALRLYARLGFRLAEDRGVYLFLEWLPPPSPRG
jgi:ribosomal protein S18 acetylase RimI-like enzyme